MQSSLSLEWLANNKVVLLGLGANNRHLAAWLAKKRILFTVRDEKIEAKESFLAEFPEAEMYITWEISKNILKKLEDFAAVFRTPSIKVLSPELVKYAKKGGIVWSQTKLFFDLCPAKMVGVTGTNGKGTTSTLLAKLLNAGYKQGKVYLGGNIGLDPFAFLDELTEKDIVILELSSFQLHDLHTSPQVAILLSLTPDHLDHHASLEEYYQAKASIFSHQKEGDFAVVHAANEIAYKLSAQAGGDVCYYRKDAPKKNSSWVEKIEEREVLFLHTGDDFESLDITERKLVGVHNLENIIPAAIVASRLGVPPKIIQQVITEFVGLPHRLQFIGTFSGASFYDDSIATGPDSAMAALRCFEGKRLHLIAGGSDKGYDLTEVAKLMVKSSATISLLPGPASVRFKPLILRAKKEQKSDCILIEHSEPRFDQALSGIQPHLQEGDIVLLAPSATSFTGFTSYKDRGEQFTKAVTERYGS